MPNWKRVDLVCHDFQADYEHHLLSTDAFVNRTFFSKTMYENFAREVNRHSDGSLVLDVGCGAGLLAERIKGHIIGVDLSEGMLKLARRRCYSCVRCDAESLPFRAGAFGLVYAHSVLHHFLGYSKILQEIRRSMVRGGLFILEEPKECKMVYGYPMKLLISGLRKLRVPLTPVASYDPHPLTNKHHKPVQTKRVLRALAHTGFGILEFKFEYYASYILNQFHNRAVHWMALRMDGHLVRWRRDGYLVLINAKAC